MENTGVIRQVLGPVIDVEFVWCMGFTTNGRNFTDRSLKSRNDSKVNRFFAHKNSELTNGRFGLINGRILELLQFEG
jgi:hypothetical protein